MKDKIKEKLLKGCGKNTSWCNIPYKCGKIEDLKHSDHIIYCIECRSKLKQHEETSKAKNEEFKKILDELIKKIENADEQIEFDEWETFMIFNIQEIKQQMEKKA